MMISKLKVLLIFSVTIFYLIVPILKFNGGNYPEISGLESPSARPLNTYFLFADEKSRAVKPQGGEKDLKEIKSAPVQDESGMLIKVMGVVLAVWVGIAVFLVRINIRIVKLEKEINDL